VIQESPIKLINSKKKPCWSTEKKKGNGKNNSLFKKSHIEKTAVGLGGRKTGGHGWNLGVISKGTFDRGKTEKTPRGYHESGLGLIS